jgi:hypothetical protein
MLPLTRRSSVAYAYYARRTVQALRLIAEAPRSATELEQHLQVGGNASRRLIGRLADDGLIEEHPDSNLQHRPYLIAAGGYDFGLLLVASGLRDLERRERDHRALTVGQVLGRYRRAHGRSQGDMAAMLGMSVSQWGGSNAVDATSTDTK